MSKAVLATSSVMRFSLDAVLELKLEDREPGDLGGAKNEALAGLIPVVVGRPERTRA